MASSFRFYLGNTLKRHYQGLLLKGLLILGIFPVPGIKTNVFMNTYNAFIIYITFLLCYLHGIIRQSELFNVDQPVKRNN